jgi:hypothetical protein
MGAYLSVIFALGLKIDLTDPENSGSSGKSCGQI